MRTWFVPGLVLVVLAPTPALADLAPPDAPPETCTPAMWESETAECLNCWGFKGYENRCANLLAPYCYVKVCQTARSYSWAEVLCRTEAADAPSVPPAIGQAIYSPLPSSSPGIADGGLDGGLEPIPTTCAPYTPQINTNPSTATKTSTQSATTTQSTTSTTSATNTTSTTSITSTTSATDTATSTTTATNTTSGTSTTTTTFSQTTASTATASDAQPRHSSACSLTTGRSAARALGWLLLVGAAMALVVRARRSR